MQEDWNSTQHYASDNCKAIITKWNCDQICLSHVSSRFTESIAIPATVPHEMVRLHFGIKGNYTFHHKQLDRRFDFIGGHHNIMYSKGFDIVVENKTPELETFDIEFPKDLFLQYTEDANEQLKIFGDHILNGRSAILGPEWLTIRLPIQNAIQEIISCKYEGQLKKLFLLSKSIEILVLSADAYNTARKPDNSFINKTADREKLIAVKDLINDQLHHPPTLSEVARSVGLNEYKLKKGFKEMFNTTVFGYLAHQRLNLAKRYIIDTDKTIAEIAYNLDYASPQHFNTAFKKKFGKTPLYIRNNPANVIR